MATDRERKSPKHIFSLPEDIIRKVFLRLPVEDLLRSKLVCKSWLSLISSSDFIKTHLAESTDDPHFTHHHLLLGRTPLDSPFRLEICSMYSLLNHDEPVNVTVQLDFPDSIRLVIGCCKGLVCLENHDNYLFFWNPSTRQSRRLPKIDTISTSCVLIYYVFCYDESNDDFKVFGISTYCSEDKLSVYSSKSDSWRLIGDFASASVFYGGYVADGAVHWVVFQERQLPGSLMTIISLDIKTETYREVLQPNFGEVEHRLHTWAMANFGESLSVLCRTYEDSRADLWVMKKRDVEESWIKLFTIPLMDNGLKRHLYIRPLCISVYGDEMLIQLDLTIALYNLKDHTLKNLPNISFESPAVYTYVESLVSPHHL